MSFENIFFKSKVILTEGALAERIKTEFKIETDEFIKHAGLIYDHPEVLELLYRQYINIGQMSNLPIMIMTPTRKANHDSIEKSYFQNQNILSDACVFLNGIKKSYKEYSNKIMIGGLLGCKGDAYSTHIKLSERESYLFHKPQTMQFQKEKIDFLFAGIMPEINETIGMAKAMAETNLPYIISFMIKKDGCLIDGTLLSDAMKIIDDKVSPRPICYMTNCIHPTNLITALNCEENKNGQLKRFSGIQANASILSPEELESCNAIQQDDFKILADEMYHLKQHYNLKIFGGCCGTNDKFLKILTKKISSTINNNV